MKNIQNKVISSFFFLFLVSCGLLPPLYAATLKGKVTLEGNVAQNPVINMDADPVCKGSYSGEAQEPKVLVNADKTLQNVFVYIKEGAPAAGGEAPKSPAVLDQKGCLY